jgi:Immunity protein 10
MSFGFHADLVRPDEYPPRLAFADRDDERLGHYFVMDRSEDSPEEAVPDLGNVYIERDDQQWGGYGGIDRVVLDRGCLSVRLDPRMAVQMGHHDEIYITFDLGEADFERLRSVLGLIMRGYENRLECRA